VSESLESGGAAFGINLIRTRTLSRERRRALFWGLIVYLSLCSVALVWVVYDSTTRLVAAWRQRGEMAALEEQFRRDNPDEAEIMAYAQDLSGTAARYAGQLGIIQSVLGKRVALPGILRGILEPLPDNVRLFNLTLDDRKRELLFELVVPIPRKGETVGSGELVAAWNDDDMLMSRVGQVRSVVSKRQRIDGVHVFVLKFACPVGDEGKKR
jgi:hypothetical protein